MKNEAFTFYEFFAGGGMARLGLGEKYRCLFANDVCPKKASSYRMNFPPADELLVKDIHQVTVRDLPGQATLAWASFPCQDLSLAGDRKGLKGKRSSTFWPFWGLIEQLVAEGRPPPIVVLENVVGAITSNGSRDFLTIMKALQGSGYFCGPLIIDSIHFVPQSRPRLFIVGMRPNQKRGQAINPGAPNPYWHPSPIVQAYGKMPPEVQKKWVWWDLSSPPLRKIKLNDIIEEEPEGVRWHSAEETNKLINMMSDVNLRKVRQAQALGKRMIGTAYRRTRKNGNGDKVQRAEVRFDQVSGCLRTPAGGSSRQIILVVERDSIRSRLISPRETARLMGVPETYKLPSNYNECYHLMGDGLVVPVISWIEKRLLSPLVDEVRAQKKVINGETSNHTLLFATGN